MKRTFFILYIALFSCGYSALAQAPDTLRAKASYSFTHIEDTTQRDKPHEEQMVVLLGRNTSAYLSMDKITQDEQRRKTIEEQIKNSVPGKFEIKVTGSQKRVTGVEIYMFANEKKMVSKQTLINNYLIEEPLPVIDWKISSEFSVISGLKCQKATAHFKGRNYIAWFCQDLPFQSGPWKLSGLPGLIVEAYDTKKEVIFKFDGFEEVKNKAEEQEKEQIINGTVLKLSGLSSEDVLKAPTISLPKDGIKTTKKEFEKLNEAMKKDPTGFINSAMAGSGMVKANSKVNVINRPNKIESNNPIELPETK
ncbi:hypothetical protein DBR11_20610 [Pedobacter sp. HMWF019]|uniref:GLPGLI family protein n=1 Tax=Pedobacter sp. HMWF019 TaxID=2056856 RepID=UPI000D37D9C3|nr:GLPGLI family protein [Pedobacter sp. HMWF019]PTS95810.1 hypothetical protein DBR11_20610 [Pedobacter sp. HMWF019]